MLLIALVGGEQDERESIAARLVDSGKARLSTYAQRTPSGASGAARARLLVAALSGPEGRRPSAGGLVVVHCLAREEADLVRAQGGVLWHLHSSPSRSVPICREDVMVSDGEAGFKHVRSPLEALSELLLDRRRAAQARARG